MKGVSWRMIDQTGCQCESGSRRMKEIVLRNTFSSPGANEEVAKAGSSISLPIRKSSRIS